MLRFCHRPRVKSGNGIGALPFATDCSLNGQGALRRHGVVHVHVGDGSFAHALYQTIRHHEVHAAVAAELAGKLAGVLPVLVFEARLVRVDRAEFLSRRAFQVNARRIIAENALGAGDQVDAVVGLRRRRCCARA